MRKLKKLNFKSTFTFDRKTAIRLCKISYYKAQARNMAAYAYIQKEKIRLSTPQQKKVTELIEKYKKMGEDKWTSTPGKILLGIYQKNKNYLQSIRFNKQKGKDPPDPVINTKLLEVVANPQMLLLAYRAIKGNRGAMTKGTEQSIERIKTYNPQQLKVYYRSLQFPDRFSLRDVFLVSELLRKGLYPWGTSSRVFVPKPGVKDKMRPITIPPFLDRVVQKSICMVLEAIYEPYFETLNRSFGFRPNKSCHDAITALTSTHSSGKITAIEGDIEAAYDTVDKNRLIEILSKKIKDRKFLKLIRERLDYDFVQTSETGEERIRPNNGIPQGGIDSPYLFNIYMNELDEFVHTDVNDFINKLNGKLKVKRSFKKLYNSLIAIDERLARQRKKIKKTLATNLDQEEVNKLRLELFENVKETRINRHRINNIKSEHPHKRNLSFLYVRYADDWIFLTNGNTQIAERIKEKIKEFFWNNLSLKLSENKTTITDIRENPAKFLGFELKHPKTTRMFRKKVTVSKKHTQTFKKRHTSRQGGSTIIWATLDKQRLINRFHMKGFCNKNGFPKELPWLATMEPHVIVERYNATIRGLSQYYYGFIRNKSDLQRWIYILRYSCIKTLAQKYKTTIKGVFKKFGTNHTSNSNRTIRVYVRLKIGEEKYEKSWTLWTYQSLMQELKTTNTRKESISETFWKIEKTGEIGEYPEKQGRIPTITNDNYLERISWVSLRTQAALDMPCANCGTLINVHQHHIRKTAYELLPDSMPYKKVMALRNRKQVPLCEFCHRKLVHAGQYSGYALFKLVPQKLFDNRTIHVESFVKPGLEYNSKSLEEKGWNKI